MCVYCFVCPHGFISVQNSYPFYSPSRFLSDTPSLSYVTLRMLFFAWFFVCFPGQFPLSSSSPLPTPSYLSSLSRHSSSFILTPSYGFVSITPYTLLSGPIHHLSLPLSLPPCRVSPPSLSTLPPFRRSHSLILINPCLPSLWSPFSVDFRGLPYLPFLAPFLIHQPTLFPSSVTIHLPFCLISFSLSLFFPPSLSFSPSFVSLPLLVS